MNLSYREQKGKIDELLDCLLHIIAKIYEEGYESVVWEEDIRIEKPYKEFLKEGLDVCFCGSVLPKSFWKSEVMFFLADREVRDKTLILEMNIIELVFMFFQGYENFEQFYTTVNLFGSDELKMKYNILLESINSR